MVAGAGITETLAEYAAGTTFDALPSEAVVAVKHLVLDALGTALAATTVGEGCRELVDMVVACGGHPQATILGFGHKGPAPLVALANGGLVHALNYDAGGSGHLGVVALVAPLAAAEAVGGVTGKHFITACAMATEVTARMSAATHGFDSEGELPWLAGQFLGYVGAATGAGRVLGLSPLQMLSAIALACMQASGIRQVVLDGDPPAKAIYGAFPNQGGMQAALMSQCGLRADCAALEGSGGFYAAFYGAQDRAHEITEGLGERYLMNRVRYKAWPTSGNVAPFIEAALALRQQYQLTPHEIQRVEFTGGPRLSHWCEPVEQRRKPQSAANAANSVFFGVANALTYGQVTLGQFTPAGFADPAVGGVADKTSFVLIQDPAAASTLTVWTSDGRTLRSPVAPSAGVVTEAQLIAKFEDCVTHAPKPPTPDRVRQVVDGVLNLEKSEDVRTVLCSL
jgi:2-methylcitrate dehydratase PrpD